MDRKEFLKKSVLGGSSLSLASSLWQSNAKSSQKSTFDQMLQQVGFNHLPNKEEKTMNSVLHKADTRGHANHGWLNTYHSFSFANYHNPERMHFGAMRVLNDDTVSGGMGFGKHPHDNMEIISIPLQGDLEHKDSMGTTSVIKEGDIQVMSAGTGVFHSEKNKNAHEEVKFLQIWIFPRERNIEPRYGQLPIREVEEQNTFYQILSPNPDDQGVWINQDAWFHMGKFQEGATDSYKVKKSGNGVYVFVLEGEVEVNGQRLGRRDGYGLWDLEALDLNAHTDAQVLLIEVPMTI